RAHVYGGTPLDGKSVTARLCPTVTSASAADNREKFKMPGVAVRSTRPKRRVVVVTPSAAVTRNAVTNPPPVIVPLRTPAPDRVSPAGNCVADHVSAGVPPVAVNVYVNGTPTVAADVRSAGSVMPMPDTRSQNVKLTT